MRSWGKVVSIAYPNQWELGEANSSWNIIKICGFFSSKKPLSSYAYLVATHLPEGAQWNYWGKIIKYK